MHAGRGKMFSGICFKKYFAFFFTEKQKKNTFHMIIIKKNDYSIPALLLE